MASKGSTKGREASLAVYKSSRRWETNRKCKLARALKLAPNNEQIPVAMKAIVYRRKTPKARVWSHSMRRIAGLMKEFKGIVHTDIFSSNEKVSAPAIMLAGPKSAHISSKDANQVHMFQLGTRVKYLGSIA
jgi:hypothetical protein